MGAGKSSFLKIYPEVTGIDLDLFIEGRIGALGDFIRKEGWHAFRDEESKSLRAALEQIGTNGILSLGGGTLDKKENLEFLKASGVKILYLEIDFETAMTRISGDENRPQLDKSREDLSELFTERASLFDQACDLKLTGTVEAWPTSWSLLKSIM